MPDFGVIDLRDITLQSGLKSLSKGVDAGNSEVKGQSFAEILKQSVTDVNNDQKVADQGVAEMISGDKKNIHETMISLEKADVSFRLMLQVRNKILSAYKEVMRMNV